MKNNDLLKLSETAILIALAIVVDQVMKIIPFLNMPNGGHISLAALFLVIIGFRNGKGYGFIGCFVYAILNWLLDGYTLHPLSIILDYVIGFGIFGLAGLFKNVLADKKYIIFVLVLFFCSSIRFISSTISGVLAWDYLLWPSIAYNGPYIYVSFLICAILGSSLIPTFSELDKILK